MHKISVLLLTQNSQQTIKRCLDSLVKFDEVIMVDGGSTDQTLRLAKNYPNVKVYNNKWNGFIAQRNFSLKQASHQWCFMIDSDEAATPPLVEKLYQIATDSNNQKVMFQVMRTEYYCGLTLDQGFGCSTYQERFFLRERVSYTGGIHHNHLIDNSPLNQKMDLVEYLAKDIRILHDNQFNFNSWLQKLPRFSSYIANEKILSGKRTNEIFILLTLFLTFFKIYKRSWKNGRVGFIIAVQEAIYKTSVKLIIYQETHLKKS